MFFEPHTFWQFVLLMTSLYIISTLAAILFMRRLLESKLSWFGVLVWGILAFGILIPACIDIRVKALHTLGTADFLTLEGVNIVMWACGLAIVFLLRGIITQAGELLGVWWHERKRHEA